MHPPIADLIRCIDWEEKEQAQRYRLDQQHTLKTLKAEGLALHPLIITRKSFGYAEYPEIRFRIPYPAESAMFRDGAAIECFNGSEEPVKGVLLEIDGQSGAFRLFAPDFPDWIEDDGVGIKLSPDTRTTGIMKDVLRNLPGNKPLITLFDQLHQQSLPAGQTVRAREQDLSFVNHLLNESQRRAVAAILDNSRVCIVHGPPGTGKTTTLVEAVRQLLAEGRKVLVSAPSNAATDHLARELLKQNLRLLRVGNSGKIDEALFPHTPEGSMAKSREEKEIKQLRIRAEEFRRMALKYKRHFGKAEREQRNLLFQEVRQIRSEIKRIRNYHEEKLFAESQVIAGTPIALYDTDLKGISFDSLIIDEAGQCLEPLAWCIIPLAKRLVLAGDPWQLPPTVLSEEARRLHFDRSILELAIDAVHPVHLLNIQYRMRESIAGFSSSYFYNNLLHTAGHLNNRGVHLTFIDTAGSGWEETAGEEGASLLNEGELRLAGLLMETENLDPENTSFISPYAGQVTAARQLLPAGMRISTIDSFQGQEAENIILSLVRSNAEGIIGFLNDYRRLNVAITRAREKLFVIGDSATLGGDPFYQAFLHYAEIHGQYRSVWEWNNLW